MSYLEKGLSLAQNIDQLFFTKGGKLQLEFDRLFKSLFIDASKYMDVVQLLSARKEGFTRKEISDRLAIASGGGLTNMLLSLEASDFITKYIPFGGSSRNIHYKLLDLFSLFHESFMLSRNTSNKHFWQSNLNSPSLYAWRGFSFAELCYVHQDEIKAALGISGMHREVQPWRCTLPDDHSQIDMLIDCEDRVINICEVKFCIGEFTIDKQYDMELRGKMQTFMNQTKTKKTPRLTLVTKYGLKSNKYSGHIQKLILMKDLF